MKASIQEFLAWCTPHAYRESNVLQYEKQIPAANQWGYVLGWYGKIATSGKWKGKYCCDCNGLAEWFLNMKLGGSHNTFSRNNYATWCKGYNGSDMAKMPQIAGTAVFRFNPVLGYVEHVGFLWKKYGTGKNDWLVVEAANSNKGVIISKFHSGWNRWGLMKLYFDYDAVEAPVPQPEPKPDVPALKRNMSLQKPMMKGDDVKQLQQRLTLLGFNCKADGVFGKETNTAVIAFQRARKLVVDGIVGNKTWGELWK